MTLSTFPELPIIVIDDEDQALSGVDITLRSAGMNNILLCNDSTRVVDTLTENDAEVILLDLIMPGMRGDELLPIIMSDFPDIPVIIVTGTGELDVAVDCMKLGAFDYMVKPVARERMITGVRRAIEMRELRRENAVLRRHVLSHELDNPEVFASFDSISGAMHSLFQYVESIVRSPEPVLITGETGVGKEVMAKCVHRLSRPDGPYVPVNVAGLDDNTFSDTLFGHRKGAFTGAMEARGGMIEKAAGGVLFLDEIGDLAPGLQVKLLRLLQEREYFPLGSDVPKHSDARIVVATNRDLNEAVASGDFRKDLYYRLWHHRVRIPPLRERPEDIPLLLNIFLTDAAEKLDKKRPSVSGQVLKLLERHDYPGNVRELQAMVIDAVGRHKTGKLSVHSFKEWLLTDGVDIVHDDAASDEGQLEGAAIRFGPHLPTLKQIQLKLIDEAMSRSGGNQSLASEMLGVTRQALSKRLRQIREQLGE